jgi:hypothetical protein
MMNYWKPYENIRKKKSWRSLVVHSSVKPKLLKWKNMYMCYINSQNPPKGCSFSWGTPLMVNLFQSTTLFHILLSSFSKDSKHGSSQVFFLIDRIVVVCMIPLFPMLLMVKIRMLVTGQMPKVSSPGASDFLCGEFLLDC